MTIKSQDIKTAITFTALLLCWIIGAQFIDTDIIGIVVISFTIFVLGPLIYLFKRKEVYLKSLIQKYAKQKNNKDLNLLAVQTAYGKWRLASVSIRLEAKNHPENPLLKEIVELMEELDLGK